MTPGAAMTTPRATRSRRGVAGVSGVPLRKPRHPDRARRPPATRRIAPRTTHRRAHRRIRLAEVGRSIGRPWVPTPSALAGRCVDRRRRATRRGRPRGGDRERGRDESSPILRMRDACMVEGVEGAERAPTARVRRSAAPPCPVARTSICRCVSQRAAKTQRARRGCAASHGMDSSPPSDAPTWRTSRRHASWIAPSSASSGRAVSNGMRRR